MIVSIRSENLSQNNDINVNIFFLIKNNSAALRCTQFRYSPLFVLQNLNSIYDCQIYESNVLKCKRLLAILLIHTSAFLVNVISSGGNITNCFRGTFSLCNLLPAHLESFLLPPEC